MKILKLTILFLCLTVNASAQPFGGSFNPEGPSSTYQIFTNTNKFVGILDASDITVQQALEDLSFIVASPTTVTSQWNFANGNLVLPQGTTCPNAGSCTDGAICYDTNATSGQRVYACESGTWTLQGDGGAGGGDSVTFNSTAASDVQFNESLPSIPASGLGVKWQIDTSTSPDSVSAYAAVSTSSVLAGVISDETGSSGGVVVFSSMPTIVTPTINDGVATITPPENNNSTKLATTAYVQTEINAMGGRSLTVTTGLMDADAELYTVRPSYTIEYPTAADDNIFQIEPPGAFTITEIACSTDVGTANINFNENVNTTPDTAGTAILSADLVCDTNRQSSCASGCDVNTISNGTIAAGNLISHMTTSVATSPTRVRVFIKGTNDD